MEIIKELFIDWKLATWANVLQVFGFLITIGALIIGLFIKSEINNLKTRYVFDKTIKEHIKKLIKSASNLNSYLNDYDNNRELIKTEFGTCQTELEDLISKLSFIQSRKGKRLIRFLNERKLRLFVVKKPVKYLLWAYLIKYPKRIYLTTYDDTWLVYNSLIEIIRQMENIITNKKNSL